MDTKSLISVRYKHSERTFWCSCLGCGITWQTGNRASARADGVAHLRDHIEGVESW